MSETRTSRHPRNRRRLTRTTGRLLAAATAMLVASGGALLGASGAQASDPSQGYGHALKGQAMVGAGGPMQNGAWNAWNGSYLVPGKGSGPEAYAYCAEHGLLAPDATGGYVYGGALRQKNGKALPAQREAEVGYALFQSDRAIAEAQRNPKAAQRAADLNAAAAYLLHEAVGPKSELPIGPNVSAGDMGFDTDWYRPQFQQNTSLYSALTTLEADAKRLAGPWKVEVSPDAKDVTAGDRVTFTVQLRSAKGFGVPNETIALETGNLSQAPKTVTTDGNGNATVRGVIGYQQASVRASGVGPAAKLTVLTPANEKDRNRVQNVVPYGSKTAYNGQAALAPRTASLGTSATDQSDGDRMLVPEGGTVVDQVTYDGLYPGQEHRLSGELMFQDSGESTGIVAEKRFVPEASSGTTELEFVVPPGYGSRSLVAFERVYLGNQLVAEHTDIADEAQTVGVSPVEIGTSATDQSDGDRTLVPEGGSIVDVVSFRGLIPGAEYTLRGELVDQGTGEPVGVTAEAKFVPEQHTGTTELVFEVPPGFAGRTLVVFERILDTDGNLVGEHTDIADEAQTVTVEPVELGTSATDQFDGDRTLVPEGGSIVDVVSFRGLVPGAEYTLKGELVDQETGEPVGVTAEAVFVPETHTGTTELVFEVPPGFAARTLVVFERVYDVGGELVAEHTDIADEAQTVTVEPVEIGTSATDQSDGDRTLAPEGGSIVDVVSFRGLVPGAEYTLKGELVDQETGVPVGVSAEAVFVPETHTGTTELVFEVPPGFATWTLVVFERMYDVDGELIAEHTDIDDEAQTVFVGPVEIGTSATDQADGDRELPAKGGTVVDVISFRGLTPGERYEIRGELMDQKTGKGTGLTVTHEFVPKVSVGTVSVTIQVPEGFAGDTLVAFERLFTMSGELVAEHTDIDDEAQTVRVRPEVPELSVTGGPPIGAMLGGTVLLLGTGLLLTLLARRRAAELVD